MAHCGHHRILKKTPFFGGGRDTYTSTRVKAVEMECQSQFL